jgi:hypothetical protein
MPASTIFKNKSIEIWMYFPWLKEQKEAKKSVTLCETKSGNFE